MSAELGPVPCCTPDEVNKLGNDVCKVEHAHGAETVTRAIAPDGTLLSALRHR